MKKLFKYSKMLLIAGMILGFSNSCTNLDEELYSTVSFDNFFKSDEEFISALGAAYSSLIGVMGSHNATWSIQEVSSDELMIPQRGGDWYDGGQWLRMFRHEYTPNEESFNNSWGQLFGGVSACNRLIEQFSAIQSDKAKAFVSELRGVRALFYYWLLDLFGNVPIVTSFSSADAAPANKSRAEVYAFIEKELTESIPNITDEVSGATYARMTKYAANALLAKLYINAQRYTGTAQWDKAITASDAIINSGKFSLEDNFFANFKTDNAGSKETIFAIPYDKVFAGGFNLPMMTLHYESQKTFNLTDQPWNGYCSLQEFYESFDNADVRKKELLAGPQFAASGARLMDGGAEANDPDGKPLTFTPEINEHFPNAIRQAGTRIGKFEYASGATPNLSNDFPIFRLADIMLVKAEALWRKNAGDATALAIVNQVRARALATPFAALTADNLLAERGREMFAEGWRRQDLIRFDKYTAARRFKPADTKTCFDIFPIPLPQLNSNKNLKQNPCY
ncbi:MAG: RagB/SusD family nutrient uptake outer membrane protein [Saprospiraceae bacterium]